MQRRSLLKTLGGIGAVATIGGAGLLASSGGARATGGASYGTASVTSDDGTVEYVAIYGDSIVKWDGFDEPADHFSQTVEARVDGGDYQTLYNTGDVDISQGADWGGDGESIEVTGGPENNEATAGVIEADIGLDSNGNPDKSTMWVIVDDGDNDSVTPEYVLPPEENRLDASQFSVGSGSDSTQDTTKTFTIEIRSTYTWYGANSNELLTEQFSADVTLDVTNAGTEVSGESGDGSNGATAA